MLMIEKTVEKLCCNSTLTSIFSTLLCFMLEWTHPALVYTIICCLSKAKPLSCTCRSEQNGQHFTHDIIKYIFLNKGVWILNKISLKCVPNSLINEKLTLVGVMAWWHLSVAHFLSQFWPRSLTLKHRETHGCVVSTVAIDALVLKHQAISIHNAD